MPPDRRVRGSAPGLSRPAFLLAAWVPTVFMDTTKAEVGSTALRQIEVVHTRVFAVGPQGGNPCPVIPSADWLSDSEMQALAREFGLDTVFILNPRSRAADVRLRYFVPDHEMGVSGHATIAAITVGRLTNRLRSDHIRVDTVTGVFEVEAVQEDNGLIVTLEQNTPVFGPTVSSDRVAQALQLDVGDIVLARGPIQSVSVSRAKLVVPLQDSSVLDTLKPDYEALWKLCDQMQVTGFYPFTHRTNKPNADVEARQFPLRAGFFEDAATGVAAAALGAYLATYNHKCQTGQCVFRIAQGYAMGTPSLMEAIAECADQKVTRTAIRGAAQVIRLEYMAL
jgi:trans-2,3-dihydro-3-hydroxyanthranilate isomerase